MRKKYLKKILATLFYFLNMYKFFTPKIKQNIQRQVFDKLQNNLILANGRCSKLDLNKNSK